MQAVREVESGQACAAAVQRKYGILGAGTMMRWVRQWGCGQHGKIIRVEKPDEITEVVRLRSQLRRAKEALADAHMELALEKTFLAVACEHLDQSVEDFKNNTLAGHTPGGPSRPAIERAQALRVDRDDAPKLLRPPQRAPPPGGRSGAGARPGGSRACAATALGRPQTLPPDCPPNSKPPA